MLGDVPSWGDGERAEEMLPLLNGVCSSLNSETDIGREESPTNSGVDRLCGDQ
jgi:hypothetical protein